MGRKNPDAADAIGLVLGGVAGTGAFVLSGGNPGVGWGVFSGVSGLVISFGRGASLGDSVAVGLAASGSTYASSRSGRVSGGYQVDSGSVSYTQQVSSNRPSSFGVSRAPLHAQKGDDHYSRNAENDKFFKEEGLHGRNDLTLGEIQGAGDYGMKQVPAADKN